jgi:hypothetical protein
MKERIFPMSNKSDMLLLIKIRDYSYFPVKDHKGYIVSCFIEAPLYKHFIVDRAVCVDGKYHNVQCEREAGSTTEQFYAKVLKVVRGLQTALCTHDTPCVSWGMPCAGSCSYWDDPLSQYA